MEIGGAGKRMRAVDGKQEINLEWPYGGTGILVDQVILMQWM